MWMHGTFEPALKTLFKQIVFVVGLTNLGKAIPCLYALLPSKEKITYLRLAESIKEELSDTGELQVSTIMMDYERGLNSAFEATFENSEIEGCDFHWKQCLQKRMSDEDLLDLYNRDANFHLLIRYIWALS
jgi:hypothetical protein